jgi:hypothetical protein
MQGSASTVLRTTLISLRNNGNRISEEPVLSDQPADFNRQYVERRVLGPESAFRGSKLRENVMRIGVPQIHLHIFMSNFQPD